MNDWITTWGNLSAILGIIVSLLGFSVAIWQIRRSVGAVEAAGNAVDATTQRFVDHQVLQAVTRALERVQEIVGLYARSQWDLASYRYADLWIALIQIKVQHRVLTEEERTRLDRLIARLQANERTLSKAVRQKTDPPKPESDLVVLQRVQSTLSGFSATLYESPPELSTR